MKEKEELVQDGLQNFLGSGGQQRWWWRKILFASLMILPFEDVSADFDRWVWKRIEKDEDWALFEVIWLRNEWDTKIWSLESKEHRHTRKGDEGYAKTQIFIDRDAL